MFEKLSDNLNRLMGDAKLNASELARLTGIPASTIKKIRNRDNPNPTLMTLLPIAAYFKQSLSDLVGDASKQEYSSENIEAQYNVPIIRWEEILSWPHPQHSCDNKIIIDHICSEHSYALKVTQRDLVGFAEEGLLIIDPSQAPAHRGYAIVCKKGQSLPTLRQLIIDDGEYYFRSTIEGNHAVITASEYQVLGAVIEYRHKFTI